jgi:hypothetical protein
MTGFGMLSSLSASQATDTSTTSNIFNKAIENAGASSLSATGTSTTDTDNQFKQQVMNNMGIGTGIDVAV